MRSGNRRVVAALPTQRALTVLGILTRRVGNGHYSKLYDGKLNLVSVEAGGIDGASCAADSNNAIISPFSCTSCQCILLLLLLPSPLDHEPLPLVPAAVSRHPKCSESQTVPSFSGRLAYRGFTNDENRYGMTLDPVLLSSVYLGLPLKTRILR